MIVFTGHQTHRSDLSAWLCDMYGARLRGTMIKIVRMFGMGAVTNQVDSMLVKTRER